MARPCCEACSSFPGAEVLAVCDSERKHRQRGEGIIEKARGRRPESFDHPRKLFDRDDVDAVMIALPCDAHDHVHADAIAAGKHLYAEKPLSITLDGCDRLIAAGSSAAVWSFTSGSSAVRIHGIARGSS